MSCVNGYWILNDDNMGRCKYYSGEICSLTKKPCGEKGVRDFKALQKDLFDEYGNYRRPILRKSMVKHNTTMLPIWGAKRYF